MDINLDAEDSATLCRPPHKVNGGAVCSAQKKRIADIHLVGCDPEVYEPCDDSFAIVDALLADRANLRKLEPTLCLEVGCGSGYVITSLALMLDGINGQKAHFLATDINEAAVETTKETLSAHHVHAEVVVADLVSGLEERLAGVVDVLVFNPPHAPTSEEDVGLYGLTSAWAGGHRGRTVIDRMLQIVGSLLSPKGIFYLVTITVNNPGEVCQIMRQKGFESCIVVQRYIEEESLQVLKFWRNPPVNCIARPLSMSSRSSSCVQCSLSQKFSCLMYSFK